jgi:hypothetical protein
VGGRRGSATLLAVGVLIGVAACGDGSATVFHPVGSIASQSPQAAPSATMAAQRYGGFGYQDYVLSMWAGVLSHGKSTGYTSQAEGNALTFVTREVTRYRSPAQTVRGTIRYSRTEVTNVYFSTGASVVSCVNATAFHAVNAHTGARLGPALPGRPVRYLEAVSEGRGSDGTWFVNRSVTYPASSTQGATCR